MFTVMAYEQYCVVDSRQNIWEDHGMECNGDSRQSDYPTVNYSYNRQNQEFLNYVPIKCNLSLMSYTGQALTKITFDNDKGTLPITNLIKMCSRFTDVDWWTWLCALISCILCKECIKENSWVGSMRQMEAGTYLEYFRNNVIITIKEFRSYWSTITSVLGMSHTGPNLSI